MLGEYGEVGPGLQSLPVVVQIHPWSLRSTPGASDSPLEPQIHRSTPGVSDPPQEAQTTPGGTSFPGMLHPWNFKSSLEPPILIGWAPCGTVSSVAHTGPRWYGIRGCWGPPSHNVEAPLGMFISLRTHILMSCYLQTLLQLRPPSQDLRLWFP